MEGVRSKYNTLKDRLFLPCVICIYLALLTISFVVKMNPFIVYDEAAQVWIGKGLNLDSPPLSPEGGIKDVIANNHDYNLDPGGLGLICYFWEKVSMDYRWLRTLPFIFFIITLVSLGYLVFKWTKSKPLSMIMALAPVVVPLLFSEAFEIRAYSMEMLGVFISIIALYNLSERVTLKRLLLWSCVLSLFLTSRYSFIPVAFMASLYVLYLIYKTDIPWRKRVIYAIVYAIPLFFTLFAIYMMAMRIQNPNAVSLDYLPYLKTHPRMLIRQKSSLYLAFLAFAIWIVFTLPDRAIIKKYKPVIYMLLATTFIFIVLSFLGVQPWIITKYKGRDGSRWCISLITLVLIFSSAVICEINSLISKKMDTRYLLLAIFCVLFIGNNINELETFKHRVNPLTGLQSVMKGDEEIYFDRAESPAMRYHFEYGMLKGSRINYPVGLTFTTADKHCYTDTDKQYYKNWYDRFPGFQDLDEYDILVVPEMKQNKKDNDGSWVELGNSGVFVRNNSIE